MVFSKQFGISVNFDVHPSGDAGYDFQLGNYTVDVKTTQYWKCPELKEFPNSVLNADIYVLVVVNLTDNWGELVGFISKRKFEKLPPRNYRNLGLRRVVTVADMCKDWELLNAYANKAKYDVEGGFKNDKDVFVKNV